MKLEVEGRKQASEDGEDKGGADVVPGGSAVEPMPATPKSGFLLCKAKKPLLFNLPSIRLLVIAVACLQGSSIRYGIFFTGSVQMDAENTHPCLLCFPAALIMRPSHPRAAQSWILSGALGGPLKQGSD